MKKITLLLMLMFVLTVSVFADDNGGIIHTGGRAANTAETDRIIEVQESDFYTEVAQFLKNIFR